MTPRPSSFPKDEGFRIEGLALDRRASRPIFIAMSTQTDIAPPETRPDHPDRHLACQEAIEPSFQALADQAVETGWSSDEVAAALVDLADNHMLALAANTETDERIRRLL